MAALRSASQPPSEKLPDDWDDAPEAEGQHHPAGIGGQPVGQLVVAPVRDAPTRSARPGSRGRAPGRAGRLRRPPTEPAGPGGRPATRLRPSTDRERPAGLGCRVGAQGWLTGSTLALQRGRPKATPLQVLHWIRTPALDVGWDHAPDRCVPGNWCGLTRWSSGRLATSHLRGPTSLTAQLDHLLSSVPAMLVTPRRRSQALTRRRDDR